MSPDEKEAVCLGRWQMVTGGLPTACPMLEHGSEAKVLYQQQRLRPCLPISKTSRSLTFPTTSRVDH